MINYSKEGGVMARDKLFLFYDINQINFYKYIPELLNSILLDPAVKVLLCYEESTSDVSALEFLAQFECIKVGLFKSIKSVFNLYDVDLVVVNAQRIPDSLCVSYAKSLGIPSVMIQHGMYNGYLKRSSDLYLKKLYKTFKYFCYSMQVGKCCNKSLFQTAIKFVKVFSFGASYSAEFSDYESIYVDCVQVYGDYWTNYHVQHFGFKPDRTKFIVVGYPELSQKLGDSKVDCCYIAQSLYEDGRISKEGLSKTLDILKDASENGSLLVKRHPRSDNRLYEKFNLGLTDELPDAKVYIGHYSSLLALPIAMGKKVALIELEGHSIPSYFKDSMHSIGSGSDLKCLLDTTEKEHDISSVFEMPIDVKKQKSLLLEVCDSYAS